MTLLRRIIAALLPQLSQPSTIIGVVTLACMIGGWTLAPDAAGAIATVCSVVASVALTVMQEDRGGDDRT